MGLYLNIFTETYCQLISQYFLLQYFSLLKLIDSLYINIFTEAY